MTYLSLYRKWRSSTFQDLVGQTAIVQTLTNAIKNNRLAHAYLFSGPRGTGKTSAARILAKAINCEQGPTPSPCGQCPACSKIRDSHSVNVIEIDAASNRGIDEIRDLREKVRYAPVEGRYKVYIIDEVHMLTPEAFNALLKTLEEPPSHTIFVLATTELQKVPLTIASRCQRLDFGRIKLPEIIAHLKKIAVAEGFEIEEAALHMVGRMAEGCMRDAVSLLDQLVSFAGNTISLDDVITLLGTADAQMLQDFAQALSRGEMDKIMLLLDQSLSEGKSSQQITSDLLAHFRDIIQCKAGAVQVLEVTPDALEKLQQQAQWFSFSALKEIARALSRVEMDMKWHPHSRLVLEIALLELLEKLTPNVLPTSTLTAAPTEKSLPVMEKATAPMVKPVAAKSVEVKPIEASIPEKAPSVEGSNFIKIKSRWTDILESVKRKSVFGYVSLHEGEPLEMKNNNQLIIAFRRGYAFHKERLEEAKNKQAIEESIREVLGERISIEGVIQEVKKEPPVLSAKAVADFFEGRIV